MTSKKSQKMLFATTLLAILALATVVATYASLVKEFDGAPVTVNDGALATVQYSTDDATGWTPNSISIDAYSSLYAELVVSDSTYSGQVTVSWSLQSQSGSSWTVVSGAPTIATTVTLAAPMTIYATTSGSISGNQNWGPYITTTGTNYRVIASVSS